MLASRLDSVGGDHIIGAPTCRGRWSEEADGEFDAMAMHHLKSQRQHQSTLELCQSCPFEAERCCKSSVRNRRSRPPSRKLQNKVYGGSLIGLLKHYTRTNCRHSPMHLHLGLHQPPLLFNRIRLRAGRARGHHVSPSPPHGNGRLAPGAIHSHGTLLATWVQNGSVNTSTLPLSALVCDPPPRFVPW